MAGSEPQKRETKRLDYITWDEYFMSVAILSGLRSKDPNTQVGACIVNDGNRIVGIGYNGFPAGCNDDTLPWGRSGDYLDTKYAYVCHAEMNAILNSDFGRMASCRMYVNLFPCNECAKMIIQAGIKEVIYISDKYADDDKFVAARKLFDMAGVKLRQMPPPEKEIKINFEKDL
jgi:dCMP deaminase